MNERKGSETKMASNTVKITTNESGDWGIVQYEDFEICNHRLNIEDWIEFLRYLGYAVDYKEVSDEEIEQMC